MLATVMMGASCPVCCIGATLQALAAVFVSEDAVYELWELAEGGVAAVKLRQQATETAFISVVAALKVVADSSYILAM